MKLHKYLLAPLLLISSAAYANHPSYTPIQKNPVDILSVNKNFEIPENISIYKITDKDTDLKTVKEMIEKINVSKKFNESDLPKHSVFYSGNFNASENRRMVIAKCVDDAGNVVFNKNISEDKVRGFLSEKISKPRNCNLLSMLSKGEQFNNNYIIHDIVFAGGIIQFPDNNDDTTFKNNMSSMKTLGLKRVLTNAKSDFLYADFVTGGESLYIIIRKFDVKDLKSMSPEEYSTKDVDNPDNKKIRNMEK